MPALSPDLNFHDAAEIWLLDRSMYLKPSTCGCYQDYIGRLKTYFAGPLNKITIDDMREYQRTRAESYDATSVNHDLNTLSQILQRAGLWKPLAEEYRPLKPKRWAPPRVMKEDEKDNFCKFAASNPDWELAYLVATLTLNTSVSGCELRGLQLKHVNMEADPPLMFVPSDTVKNEYRSRVTPLIDEALEAMRRILARAHRLGSHRPEHYLFPFRVKRNFFDPNRPASESWIKSQWKALVDAAIKNRVISFRVRAHDMRHQIITELLEKGTPEETVKAIAGHVSANIIKVYSHTRVDAKFEALNRLSNKPQKRKPHSAAAPLGGLSISSLISGLKQQGMSPDQILNLIAGAQAGQTGAQTHAD